MMKNHHFLKISLNFAAVILLLTLVVTPFYFARQFSQVSGVKSETQYLVVSQVEKFPGMYLSQTGNRYEISFERQNPSQAYMAVLIVNNPTNKAKTYSLQASSGATTAFFGEDLDSLLTQINVPAGVSVPISLISQGDSASTQTIELSIETN
ncbi:MAG: hypothetical protein UU34_C0021G0008 [Candidatus Curtissbacteria bacterium GW2011_GWA1_41_11]|uniref:DUF1616 domain-containing protein n=1 Tax=Candidatus Curtissbacteria bacterium GW2011_GWA1_41_11 TaxID=1618409 RepID=A0A0G0UAX5_9BACT|nr:MAG: hypothetical protein UU34_C0021G0008 [Candidatus Curtissbacteria bacterium GW2011_GWA1_41_11]